MASLESYAHKAAKDVVVSWLDAAEADMLDDIYACCLDNNWVTPSYWQEYPVLPNGTGLRPCWTGKIPDFDALSAIKTPPAVIFDVAISEYGRDFGIRTGIEIVHKNPPSYRKLAVLREFGLRELLVLPAQWVLGQIGPPKRTPEEFWLWR